MAVKHKTESSWCHEKLKGCSCKLTKPREAILDVLNNTRKHLSAEKIYKGSSKIYPAVGLATVYRNLELLVRIGAVCKFNIGDKKARYGVAQRPGESHHHHLICKNCNSVIDYSGLIDDEKEFLRQREKKLAREYDFKIEGHFIDFFGLCKECKDREIRS